MKRNILNKFLIAGVLMLATLISLQSTTVIAEGGETDDDEVDGELTSQNYNNRASVIDFDLADSSNSTTVDSGTSLDPNTSYTAQVTIKDPDTIRDLNSVKFYFYYQDIESPSTPGALTLTQSAVTDDTGSQFVVEWNTTTNAIQVVSSGAINTWDLVSNTVPSSTDFDGTDFIFEFEFKISKVATETSDANWFFGTVISDGAESLESGVDDELIVDKGLLLSTGSSITNPPSKWSMNFYGEIELTQSNVSWSGVAAGADFDETNSEATLSGTTYIANGAYSTRIKSSALWNAMITEENVNQLISGFSNTAIDAFTEQYNNDFSSTPTTTTGAITDLVGIPYHEANQVIEEIDGDHDTWEEIEFLLPESSEGSNLIGASLVTGSSVINGAETKEQFFMIGYDSNELNLPNTEGNFELVGTEFRQFVPNGSPTQSHTLEAGDMEALNLHLYLSEVFQNAQYKGTLTIQITNE